MNLDSALTEIRTAMKRLTALYGEQLFDEWVLVAINDQGCALQCYEGPRADQFRASFGKDVAKLRVELAEDDLGVGGMAFGAGTHGGTYDAVMRAGPAAYLLGNHTARSMEEIRAKPEWLKAQAAWFMLGEKFRADPLG
jgi:hypothetical protein